MRKASTFVHRGKEKNHLHPNLHSVISFPILSTTDSTSNAPTFEDDSSGPYRSLRTAISRGGMQGIVGNRVGPEPAGSSGVAGRDDGLGRLSVSEPGVLPDDTDCVAIGFASGSLSRAQAMEAWNLGSA